MYKVIVVDDERRTRIGITTIIDWKQSGFKIVDTAANGFDALTKYEEHIPDLFIVDIKMPGMNGMELVERLKEKNKHIKIIFLSGFAEFEYAQQAIRFQAAGYLLKPLEEGELMKLLAKVKGELDKERQVSQTIKWKVEEENNRLIATTLKGTITEESKQFFQYHLDWNRYTLLLIKIANLHEVDTTSVVHELRLICNEEGIVFHCEGNYGLMTNYELTSRRWTELCRKVKNIMDKSGLIFCCAISTSANTIQDIPKSYQEAVYLLEDSFYYEKEFITIDTSSWCERKMDHSHSVGFMKDKLAYATELSDKGSISKTVEEMIILYAKQRVSSTVVKKQISQMLLEITDRLSDMYPGVKCQFKRNQLNSGRLLTILQAKDIIPFATEYLVELARCINQDNQQLIVKKMKHFIENHYHENIRLSMLADLLNYHKGYLGKIFKDNTGEYFNTYVDKLRIRKSKLLLKQGYKVYEVAVLVGYHNADYFYNKFKKYENISPSKYRKNHISIQNRKGETAIN